MTDRQTGTREDQLELAIDRRGAGSAGSGGGQRARRAQRTLAAADRKIKDIVGLQYAVCGTALEHGFQVDGVNANDFRDHWGVIHARQMHPSFYDPEELRLSQPGIDYLTPIFRNAIGQDDLETVRTSLFKPSNLSQPYHSVNVDVNKRICFLDE